MASYGIFCSGQYFCACTKINGIGLLSTHKKGDFGATSGTEQSYAAPRRADLEVERFISDRFCATLWTGKKEDWLEPINTSEGKTTTTNA